MNILQALSELLPDSSNSILTLENLRMQVLILQNLACMVKLTTVLEHQYKVFLTLEIERELRVYCIQFTSTKNAFK